MCEECAKLNKLLARIADVVAGQPTVTGLQTACVNDYNLIPMAIRDAQDAFRDTVKRLQRQSHTKNTKSAD